MGRGLTIRIFRLAVAWLLVASQLPASAQNDPLRHGYALIIANWTYKDRRWAPLTDIQLQIQQLKAALDAHFDQVEVLPNPTFDQLDNGLRGFLRLRGNDENARLFIYYAGHGYTETDLSRNAYRGYITATDTPYVDGSSTGYSAARVKSISMEAIRGMVSDANARQLLFMFDSCFAGTIFTGRAPSNRAIRLSESDVQRLSALPVREFITAGDYNQTIPAQSPLPHLLVNALEGDADPYGTGVISGTALAQYIWTQLQSQNLTPREGKLQSSNFDRGEFLFRVIKRQKYTVELSSAIGENKFDYDIFTKRYDLFGSYKTQQNAKTILGLVPDSQEINAVASAMREYPNSIAKIDIHLKVFSYCDLLSSQNPVTCRINNIRQTLAARAKIREKLTASGIQSDRIITGSDYEDALFEYADIFLER